VQYILGTTQLVIIMEGDKTYSKLYFSRTPKYIETYGFEVSTYVDSINIDDKQGKEVVMRIESNIDNNYTFYTDSNGMEEQKRIINYRPTWPFVTDEIASSNYYPVNSHITIKDINNQHRLTVLVDRSEGGSVLKEGCIELMLHRRTVHDDERGVFEPLNETEADGKGLRQIIRHYIVFGEDYRKVQKRNDQPILIMWSNTSASNFTNRQTTPTALHVPDDVKLFLRPLGSDDYILRLHNFNTNQPVIF
jgi:hypothetical protein